MQNKSAARLHQLIKSWHSAGRITQAGLGKKAGVGQSAVSRIVRGESNITLDALDRLARALGYPPWQLIAPPPDTARAEAIQQVVGLIERMNDADIARVLALIRTLAEHAGTEPRSAKKHL